MKAELKAINSKLNNAEKWISDLKDRIMKITQSEQQTERQMKKNESSVWDLWGNIKHPDLCIIQIPEEKKEKGIESLFEKIMAENFPNGKEARIYREEKITIGK